MKSRSTTLSVTDTTCVRVTKSQRGCVTVTRYVSPAANAEARDALARLTNITTRLEKTGRLE